MAELGGTWLVGTRVKLTAVFSPLGLATPTDPDTVKMKVRTPSGTVTTFTFGIDAIVVKDGVGTYSYRRLIDASGTWWFSWHAESTIAGLSAVEELAVKAETAVIP